MKEKVRSFLSSKKDEQNRQKAAQDNLFNPDYIDFDEFGHVAVRCMRCGSPIMGRTEIPTQNPAVKTIGMKKFSNYREISRNGKATILCCVQCEPLLQSRTEEDEDRLETVHLQGWISGMVWVGKKDEHIKHFISTMRKE